MLDRYNRIINYVRISVTDRCNLRCLYCMPEEGIELMKHEDILTFEEIAKIVKEGVSLGIKCIRLTGGEPLVRKGIVKLVEMLAHIEGIEEVSMTTNGTLLPEFAKGLASAGLKRLNISIDTLDPGKYSYLTRGGDINHVLKGIEAAKKAGLAPIKLNCVVMDSAYEPDAKAVASFAKENGLKVQFIHQMNLETGQFSRVEGGNGGNCQTCNRLRITANGFIKPCLFNPLGFNVREYGIPEAFRLAVDNKPQSGTKNKSGKFYNIGG
jgi:cyclic pyranopterin phosphate synthase